MKIALFMCGETRSFNVDGKFQLLKLKNVIESTGHTLDCYGLHWDDCDYPDQDVVKFKQIKTVSQQIIREWVERDIENRAIANIGYARERWEQLYDMDLNKIPYDELVYSSYTSLGQVIGGWMALQMIPQEYDLYIRWRWDCSITVGNFTHGEVIFDYVRQTYGCKDFEEVKNILIDPRLRGFVLQLEEFHNENSEYVGALALGTSVVSKTAAMSTIDDVFFVFSKRIKDKIDALDMWNFFGEFLSKYDFEWRPDSHNLWTNPIIDDLDENIKLAVPDIIGFTRTSERETEELRYKAYWDKYERTYGKPVLGKATCDPW